MDNSHTVKAELILEDKDYRMPIIRSGKYLGVVFSDVFSCVHLKCMHLFIQY